MGNNNYHRFHIIYHFKRTMHIMGIAITGVAGQKLGRRGIGHVDHVQTATARSAPHRVGHFGIFVDVDIVRISLSGIKKWTEHHRHPTKDCIG
jgi:hypothetical protein